MSRQVKAKIFIKGVDDEMWPSSDVHIHREFHREWILDTNTPAFVSEIPDVRWGGECRLEVDIIGKLLTRGRVEIEVEARFYEGTSEDTDDLADEKSITFAVPPNGSPVHRHIHLRNTEIGGGDSADVRLSFTNTLVEE